MKCPVEDPFNSPHLVPWKSLRALYVEKKRTEVKTWEEFCRGFDVTPKTVKAIRDEYGIDETVGPQARPSPNFRTSYDHFLGEGI